MPAPAATLPCGDEIFDVVDLSDTVLRQERRSVVHRHGLFHRAVHIFVFNRAGEVFLQKRSMRKDTAPGKWVSSVSGHVDSGADYDVAARRELSEEIGLDAPDELSRVFKEVPCRATGNEFTWVYTCRAEGPFTLDPEEVSDGRWVAEAELENWLRTRPRDFAWSFAHLWARYRELRTP